MFQMQFSCSTVYLCNIQKKNKQYEGEFDVKAEQQVWKECDEDRTLDRTQQPPLMQ